MDEKKRGRCPVCERDMVLKKDGTLRHHGGPEGSGMWPHRRAYRCEGSDRRPVDADEDDQ